jgi:sulfur carrier protein
MSLTLVFNGHPRTFDSLSDPTTLELLIAELALKGDRIAVEHNGTITPRAAWPGTNLTTGDRLEVVHFVGGGLSSLLP